MNSLVAHYRERVPNDTRSDEELTLLLGKGNADGRYNSFPDFLQDYARLTGPSEPEDKPVSAKFREGVQQAAGSAVRAVADVPAGLMESIGIAATKLNQAVPLGGEDKPEDTFSYKAGQAIRNFAERITPEANPDLENSFLATKLPATFGSIIGFVAGAGLEKALVKGSLGMVMEAAAKDAFSEALAAGATKEAASEAAKLAGDAVLRHASVKAAEMIPNGVLGAGTQAAAAYKEAVASGASPDQAFDAYLLNLPVGAAMAFPAHAILGEGKSLPGKVLRDAATGAGTMGVQQVASNIIARDTFDPERSAMAGVGEGATAGGIVTAALSALSHKLMGASKPKQEFDPAIETHFANVPDERRQQIAELKARMDTGKPKAEDIAAYRTLNAEESAFYAVAEPVDGGTTTEDSPTQGEVVPPPSTVETTTDTAGADTTAPASAAPDAAAIARANELKAASARALVASRQDPAAEAARAKVKAAADKTDPNPTPAQIEAGNYAKGKVSIDGIPIAIETAKGETRRSKPGQPVWETTMANHYGQILGTKGADGDPIDVYIGEHPTAERVYVVDQIDPKTGKFDEAKTMLGFASKDEAIAGYDAGFSDGSGPSRRGAVTEMSRDNFKAWLKEGNTKDPLAYKEGDIAESQGATKADVSEPSGAADGVAAVPTDSEGVSKGGESDGKINEGQGQKEGVLKEESPDNKAARVSETITGSNGEKAPEMPAEAGANPAPEPPVRKPIAIKPTEVDIENRGTYLESGRGKKGGESATVQPAWFVPKTQDHATLSKQLLSDSSPPSGKHRNSETYRQTAILDHQTGTVHVVSTFENNKQTRVTKFTDDIGPKQKRAKSLSLADVLDAKDQDGKPRFEVLGSARTRDLTEYVHDQYPDLKTFHSEFSDPLEQQARAVQSSAAVMEEKLAQADDYRTEQQEHPETGEIAEEGTSAGDAYVDYQESAMADSINLEPGEVNLLVDELPAFEELGELADFVQNNASRELKDVLKKVARQDPDFFKRVMADGLETVLKDYGHEIESVKADTGKGGPVEQSATERPQADLRPAEQRGEGRDGDTAPAVAEQQDRVGQTEGTERGGEARAGAGNEVADQSGGEAVRYTKPGKQFDKSPTLIYQDTNGEPTTRPENQLEPGSRLGGAIRSLARGNDGGRDARSTAAELQGFAQENGLVLDPETFTRTVIEGRKFLADGSEHSVYVDKVTKRVIKLTHPDYAGDGNVGQSDLLTYLQSLEGQNQQFGDDIRLEGIVSLDGEFPQIVISQPFIKGREATVNEIATFMSARGFKLVDGTWTKGSVKIDDAVPKNVMAVDRKDGSVTVIPFDVQVRGSEQAVKQTTPTLATAESSPEHAALVQSIHQAAAAAGITVQQVDGALGMGAYDPKSRTLMQVIGETVGRQDVKTAFHEVAHDVFASEAPDVRERLVNGIARLSDDALGVDLSADTRIRSSDPANLGHGILQEERLVDATAEKLTQQGFDPAQAKGFAQSFVRGLKDMYLRAAMAVQRMLGFKENPELARRYFENRVKRLLAGDNGPSSYIDFIGAGKPSAGDRQIQWFPSSKNAERFDRYGGVEYDHQPDTSLAASRFNQDQALRLNQPTDDPQYSRVTEIEKRVAVLNHQSDLIQEAADALLESKELSQVIKDSGKTPDAFLRDLMVIADPADMKRMLSEAKERDGSAVVYDPDKKIDGFKARSNADAVLSQAYRNTEALLSKVSKARERAVETIETLTSRRIRLKDRYDKAKSNYKDWQYQTTEAVRAMRKDASELMRSIAGTSKRQGAIEQQLRALDPAGVLKEYGSVFQNLFTGDQLKGEKLFDLLDKLASDETIDFSKPIREIKDALLLAYTEKGAPYDRLLGDSKEGKALLATVVAFAKTHQKIMAEIELRRLKNGEERVAIEKSIDALAEGKKEFSGNLREMAKTAKLEERMRAAHSGALKDLRELDRRIAKSKIRISAADQVGPVLNRKQAELASQLQLAADATWRDGMPYNVPEKATAKSDEVVKSVKTLALDSSGKVTDPATVEQHLAKMAEFMAERERRHNEGDVDAKDAVYQGVRRQFEEILENKNFKVKVGPAQRFMTELAVMPVGRRMADAFGTPAARMIDTLINRFTDVHNEMRPEAERVGRKNDQLEDVLLKMMPGINRDYLRDNFLNPAKKLMQRQHDLEEIYADQPEKLKKAIYGRVREMLLANAATRQHVAKVIDTFMPQMAKLIEFQHDANKFLLERVSRAGTGVLDPKLRVANPATGEVESGVRRHLQVGAYTFSQKLHHTFGVMINALRNSDWDSLGDVLNKKDENGKLIEGETLAKIYNEQGADAARAEVERFFNHPEYYDQVQKSFFQALAEMDTESAFNAPALADAITKPPADPMKVREAFEISKGEPIAFAEAMHELHGGQGDKGQYVQDTLQRLNEIYHEVNSLFNKHDGSGSERMVAIRGMTSDALIDARSIEHLPGSWFDYHSFDQRDMFKMVERIASQTAFGRGQERLASAFDTVASEATYAQNRLATAVAEIRRLNPTAEPKEVEAALVKKFGKEEYQKLKTQTERAKFVRQSVKELSDYFRRDNAVDGTLKVATRAGQMLGNLLVNSPSSALYQMAALIDINMKYGAAKSTLGATLKTVGAAGREVAGSLAQAVGVEMFTGSEYHRRFVDLGLTDAAVSRKLRDAFDRLQGEKAASHFFRGANDLLGAGLNRLGEKAEHTVFRPLQPFISSAMAANKALTEGMWRLVGNHVMAGMEFYKAHPELANDASHKLTADMLGLKGSGKDSFARLNQDMERWGLDYNDMVRGAMKRGDKTLFTDAEAMRLYSMMLAEVSSESNLSTMPLSAYNNSLIRFALPLLGWSFRRMQQIGTLRLDTEGKHNLKAMAYGLSGLAAVAAGGLGLSALMDEYYEKVLNKKRNLRPVIGSPNAKETALAVLENLNRVGTFGFFGEMINAAVGAGEGGDNRMLSVDQRVVALASMQAVKRAINAWVNQGEADYQHVVRPLATTLGGGGLIQYMQIANNAFGFDNPESRTTARMNAQNYLRVTGRQLGLDIRTFSGGSSTQPTPLTPALSRMEMAAYGNDQGAFQEAYLQAIQAAREQGIADPVDHVKRAYAARNPLRNVFKTPPSEAQYRSILAALPEDGRRDVSEAVSQYNDFAERIGARGFEGKAEKKSAAFKVEKPKLPKFGINDLRNRSVSALFAQ